jgi:sugar phosphate permease
VPFLILSYGLTATLGMIIAILLVCCVIVQPFRRSLDGERSAGHEGWMQALFQPAAMLSCVSSLRSHPSLPMLTGIGASFSLMQACLSAFTATYFVTRHGASLVEAGQVVAMMQGASIVGRVVLGWLADRMGNALRHLGVQAIVSAIAVYMMVTLGNQQPGLLHASAALVGFTAIGWNGVHIAELARVAPLHLVSNVTSAASLFGFLASVLGPLLFMLLVSWGAGYETAFHVLGVQLACYGVCCLVVRKREP